MRRADPAGQKANQDVSLLNSDGCLKWALLCGFKGTVHDKIKNTYFPLYLLRLFWRWSLRDVHLLSHIMQRDETLLVRLKKICLKTDVTFAQIMTRLIKIIHRSCCEQFHARTIISVSPCWCKGVITHGLVWQLSQGGQRLCFQHGHEQQQPFHPETTHNKVCASSWATGSWFLEGDIDVEVSQIVSILQYNEEKADIVSTWQLSQKQSRWINSPTGKTRNKLLIFLPPL